MSKPRKRKDQMPYRVPGYDDLANRGRDTGAPNDNRIVVARTDRTGIDDRPTVRNYSMDPVIYMLNRGTINGRLAMAGSQFHVAFVDAWSSNVPAMDLEQAIGQGGKSPLYPAGGACLVSWNREVQPALESLGPTGTPMWLVAWHVLGMGKSLRMFAETVGWEGMKPRPVMAASGILTSALRTLADHYGLEN